MCPGLRGPTETIGRRGWGSLIAQALPGALLGIFCVALATTPARLFGLSTKGALEVGRDADLVLFDPAARRVLNAADLHHTSDYTPYEGMSVRGAVRSVFVRGRAVIRDGTFVGTRGAGLTLGRELTE